MFPLLLLVVVSADRIIIDTDGVTDDIRAIGLALTKTIIGTSHELLAITTVRGGVTPEQAAINVNRLLRLHNKTIPIFKGTDQALVETGPVIVWEEAFGFDGLGGVPDLNPAEVTNDVVWQNLTAEDAIIEFSREYSNLVLVCIGPLTNIARAIQKDPEFVSRPKKIIVLGGNFMGMGNNHNNNTGEFNFYSDPEAAQLVISLMKSDMLIIPIETINMRGAEHSEQVNFMDYLRVNTTTSKFLNATSWITQKYMEKLGQSFVPMDDLAVAAALNPSVIDKKISLNVNVELAKDSFTRGQVVVDYMSAVFNTTLNFYSSTVQDNGYGFPLRTFAYDYDPYEVNYMLKQMARSD